MTGISELGRAALLAAVIMVGTRLSVSDSSLHVCVSDSIQRLKSLISIREGWRNPASLVRRNHNPGALRARSAYFRFRSDRAGWDALDGLLRKRLAMRQDLRRAWAYLPSATGE